MAQDMSHEESQMYEKLLELIGSRIRIACDRTVYEGIVGSLIPGLRMVSLRHSTLITGDYLGVTRFRFREIASLTVVESGEVVNRYSRNDYLLDILKNKAGKKYNINDVLFDGRLSDPSDDENSADEESTEQDFVLELPPYLKNQLPNESLVIDSVDENFTQAVQDIRNQDVIGVSFDGPQISRFGKLTSLCISTMSHVYLFDIEIMKSEAFDNGLRDVLEDTSIKKVIHDCRFPSDCLAHRYYTQLSNVFDTKVADFIINMQRYNDKYEFKSVSSLDCCLRNHLDIPPELLYKRVKGLSDKEKNDLYTKRPINNEFRYDLIKDALFLILLQKTLGEKLLDPLRKNVNVYLGLIANASQEEIDTLGSEISPPDSLPPAVYMYGIQTARFHKHEKKSVALECKFMNPKTGQVIKPKKVTCAESDVQKINLNVVERIIDQVHKADHVLNIDSKCEKDNLSSVPAASNPAPSGMNYETVDGVMMPSFRHMDEVYHRLVNNQSLRSQHPESVVNVKPPENYTSTFTFKRPVDTGKDVDSALEFPCTSKTALDNVQNLCDSSDFWASLCASSVEQNTSSLSSDKKYRFVPA